ncbi:MAG: hypothetical protein AAF567_10820 [Actinomycetota bacterium]
MITWDALDALSHAFELNGIGPGSTVIAVVGDDPDLALLVRTALARSRAEAVEVHPVRSGPGDLAGLLDGPLLSSMLDAADIVIDALPDPGLADLDLGGALLRLHPAAATAELRPPHANLDTRVQVLRELLASGVDMAIRDDNGTDLSLWTEGGEITGDGGRVGGPGDRAEFPSGWVRVVPAAGSVHGTVVLMPGDANLTRGAHFDSPVRLEIHDDLITAIDGDSPDADVIRALLEHIDHDHAYGFSSFGLGMNPGRRTTGGPFDPELVDDTLATLTAGVVRLAFGDNLVADRPCGATIALALAGRDIAVDGADLCRGGELVGDIAPDVYELPD